MSDRQFVVEPMTVGPPLMLVFKGRLSQEARENLRRSWELGWQGGAEVQKIVGVEAAEVYQLLDGRWMKLGEEVADAQCSPISSPAADRPGDSPPGL